MVIQGYISDADANCIYITAPFSDTYLLEKQGITDCEIYLNDGRQISKEQRQAICATCNDIGEWTGNFELERQIQTYAFCDMYDYEPFSLSRKSPMCASVSLAREFLTYLINFCVIHGVACSESLLARCEDIGAYLYASLANKRCAICGDKPDLHHVNAIGMGRDRTEIVHEGMEVLPLCRVHHSEAHTIGRDSFCERYHLFGIKLDKHICKIWRLKTA